LGKDRKILSRLETTQDHLARNRPRARAESVTWTGKRTSSTAIENTSLHIGVDASGESADARILYVVSLKPPRGEPLNRGPKGRHTTYLEKASELP